MERVRVLGAACGAACAASDRYRVRYYDTTYTIPRFNNTGTQSTVLVIQNATERQCLAKWCGYGGLAGKAVSIEPSTGFTFDTPLVPRPH